ncbi:6554_t:CDS:1 [Funneliformis geosporum]|uniref:2522_t:CDS:1 n=1 Tax=Funneliformis geosporum TaxID=1117311 RepID=A0A9W4ST94_9GLOM|nr:2522_t:CDS:1 [Funneliformis geosporum]CAI2196175.1 6554_t:CDS:1 [Funneliformis geosporum]
MSTLPGDCLAQIFSYLDEDSKSLYAFIRVNRLWCVNAIKYLWKQPLRFALILKNTTAYTLRHRTKTGKLAETFIKCLIHNEMVAGGEIQNRRRRSPRVPLVSPPLFNYIGFIRRLDLDDLGLTIAEWAEYISSPKYNRNSSLVKVRNVVFSVLIQQRPARYKSIKDFREDKSLIKELTVRVCELLINQIQKLDYLSIKPIQDFPTSDILFTHLMKGSWFNLITKDYMSIINYPHANVSLSHLVEFEWDESMAEAESSRQFLLDLSRVCTKIQTIKFDMNKLQSQSLLISEALQILIESQTRLEEFELRNCDLYSYHIMHGLKKRASTLKKLTLRQVDSSSLEFISDIAYLYSLEELRYYEGNLLSKDAWPLSFTHFPKLILYEIDDLFPTTITVNPDALVSDSCPILQTFIYNQKRFYKAESTSLIIKSVGLNCQFLRHFECNAEICSIDLLKFVFISSSNLETIIITNDRVSLNIDGLLLVIRLKNLKYLELNGSWEFEVEPLKRFLINSKPPLSTIVLSENKCFEDSHLQVLLRYLKGVLTTFHVFKLTKRLSIDMRRQAKEDIEDFLYKRKTNVDD